MEFFGRLTRIPYRYSPWIGVMFVAEGCWSRLYWFFYWILTLLNWRNIISCASRCTGCTKLKFGQGQIFVAARCGIAVFCVFRDKPRYLFFPQQIGDFFKFPWWIAIPLLFPHQIAIFQITKHQNFQGYQLSEAFLTNRYKSWPNFTKSKVDQTLQKLTKRYKSWPNVDKVDQTLRNFTKRYKTLPNVTKLDRML
jgi:hypothetical protein